MHLLLALPAPAKLNLFLHVTGRRADGYHELQTAYALIELADTAGGKVLLWIIAIGLFAYGVFCIAEAKYRKAA